MTRTYQLHELADLLRDDANWLREARTREQEAALRGVDVRHLNIGDVHWTRDPEVQAKDNERAMKWLMRRD